MKTTYKNKTRYRCDWCRKLIPIDNGPYTASFIGGHYYNHIQAVKAFAWRNQLHPACGGEQMTGHVIPVKNPGGGK
jgi:hypothetical protein